MQRMKRLLSKLARGSRKDPKKRFLRFAAGDPAAASQSSGAAGTSELHMISAGYVPSGHYVIHKFPLDGGGTNEPDNLMLMADGKYYYALTNHQRTMTAGFEGRPK
jgi:hypothetical protein